MGRGRGWRFHLARIAGVFAAVLIAVCASPAGAGAVQSACPNATLVGFQEYLPGCGAYEMVSPPFKDGNAMQGIAALSSDGSRAIVSAVGAFAGTESDVLGVKYEFSRTPSGWVASSINPPASVFPVIDTKLFAASVDLNKTLWALRVPSQSARAKDLYLRDVGGAFVKIGPAVPPSATEGPPAGGSQEFKETYEYAGVSGDLSHVLFEAIAVGAFSHPWPGDSTLKAGDSLYEYAGTKNTVPDLVGVSDGSTVLNKETLVAGRLISDCSTYLGSEASLENYNAVSADGEKVFFTAIGKAGSSQCKEAPGNQPEANELYARIANLETVPLSEPTAAQCGECKTATKANAIFQGASRDGSKAFFLTEQELLPGAEGKNLYEYDFGNLVGHKIVRVAGAVAKPEVQGVARVSEDGSHVYFVAGGLLTGENKEHVAPVEKEPNLYVFERDAAYPAGRLAFIGTLSGEDKRDWQKKDQRAVQATPDGRYLAFESVADLTPGDTSVQPQVFEYDAQSEELVRVSVGQAGFAEGQTSADENASEMLVQIYATGGFKPAAAQTNLVISADGAEVAFGSAGALTPEATEAAAAGRESIYEYRSEGPISAGDVHLISDGKNQLTPQGGAFAGLDPSGTNVFFLSIDPILPQDGDLQFDLYDAHSGGGFQAPPSPPSCQGEACQGAPAAQPLFGSAASLTTQGTPNPPSPPPAALGEPGTAPTAKPPSRAQKLASALRACKRKKGKQRSKCQTQARKRFGAKSAARNAKPNAKGQR